MSEPLRLNLGAGRCLLPEYVNLDASYPAEGVWQNGRVFGLPYAVYPLNSYDDGAAVEIRASHILEHFGHTQTYDVLTEWVRVLAPGGLLKLAVPDFDRIISAYQSGEEHPVEAWIMGGQTNERDHHGALFNAETLTAALQQLGLVDVTRWESEIGDCASLPISLNLQARKPALGEVTEAKTAEPLPTMEPVAAEPIHMPAGAVKAVMSAPRLGFLDTMECAYRAFSQLGIGLCRGGGAFWHQSLTNMMERTLDGTTRYIVTLDYDTLFTPDDVLALLRIMETRPEIDFLCSLQARRGKEAPLFTVETGEPPTCGPREVRLSLTDLAADTMPIASGHFGLTVLRVSSLERLPKPWFQSVPDAAGGYGDGRTDADIFFWQQANAAGMVTHVANRVVVGHLELMVSWPDQSMRNRHQYTQEYNDSGKPAWAWR